MLVLLVPEILRVYYIMPFPGSQEDMPTDPRQVDIAYWLHTNIWWVRFIGLALIIGPFIDYLRTGNVRAAVNLERDRAAHYTVVVRHRDRVGVLAGILGGLREEQLNVQEMSNVVFQGSETACATIALENQPSAALLERLRAQPDVLAVDLRAMP